MGVICHLSGTDASDGVRDSPETYPTHGDRRPPLESLTVGQRVKRGLLRSRRGER